jgi:hypothetical protein
VHFYRYLLVFQGNLLLHEWYGRGAEKCYGYRKGTRALSETVGANVTEKKSSWYLKIQVLGTYCCVSRCVISGVRKDCVSFVCRLKQLKKSRNARRQDVVYGHC